MDYEWQIVHALAKVLGCTHEEAEEAYYAAVQENIEYDKRVHLIHEHDQELEAEHGIHVR